MKPEMGLEAMLRWRLQRAESEAPPAPSAARLLALSLPWWERTPEIFQALMEKFGVSFEHAVKEGQVETLLVAGEKTSRGFVQVLESRVDQSKLRLRFQLVAPLVTNEPSVEATFVTLTGECLPFCASAGKLAENEFQVEAELVSSWAQLCSSGVIPFRLILRLETQS